MDKQIPKVSKQFDWPKIQVEYELGQKSLRMLTKEFGPAPPTILKHAKAEGWVQDKTEEINRKTKAALVGGEQQGVNVRVNTPTREDIERAVESNVRVIRDHRKDIRDGRELTEMLFGQLREAADMRDEIEGEIIEQTKGNDDKKADYKRRNAMLKAVSLPAHASVLRDLSTALKNLIPLERQAFNLDSKDSESKPLSENLTDGETESIRMVAKMVAVEIVKR